jgi:hypothetical protein
MARPPDKAAPPKTGGTTTEPAATPEGPRQHTPRVRHDRVACLTCTGSVAWRVGRRHALDMWGWAHHYRRIADLPDDEAAA